jgi:hypothetical protein
MLIVCGVCRPQHDTLFDADFTTQTPGYLTDLAKFGLVYSRLSSGYSVRTGTSTVLTGGSITGASIPSIGRDADADLPGLVIEEGRTNYVANSRDHAAGGWFSGTGTYTYTADYAAGPDGSVLADRSQVSSNSYSYQWSPTGAAPGAYCVSTWHKQGSGGANGAALFRVDGTTYSVIYTGTEPSVWTRTSLNQTTTATNAMLWFISYGFDTTIVGGSLGAGSRDTLNDMEQVEQGSFPTQFILTSGATASRASPRVTKTVGSTLLDTTGALRFYLECRPCGSSAQYTSDLQLWRVDANNHAEIDYTTLSIKVTIAGTTYTTPVAMSWARGDILRIWVAAGGSVATEVKYSTNTGSPINMSTGSPPTFGAITISGALDLWQNNTANVLSAYMMRQRFYKAAKKPAGF